MSRASTSRTSCLISFRNRGALGMKFRRILALGLALASVSAFHAAGASSAVSAQQTQSIWDGIYTKEQAERGNNLYAQYCAACHSQDLMGGEIAPPLSGGQFVSNWNTLS